MRAVDWIILVAALSFWAVAMVAVPVSLGIAERAARCDLLRICEAP